MSTIRNIPFFNYQALYKSKEAEILATIRDVLERGAYIMQKDLVQFEENLKKYLGVKYVFGVADGTNALKLNLLAAGVGAGDEVIMASHTYIATAAAVHFVGATPVLVECGADHMIDPASIEEHITDKTKAIMPTQLNGRTADMDAICGIAGKHGLIILEDSAQGLGSKFKGKFAGTFGKAGTFSFYPAKLLGCFGDGGACITDDDEMARKISLLRDHGRDESGEVVAWGTNSRLDNIQAAVLDLKLKTFDEDLARRREIAAMYQAQLGSLEELALPPAPDNGDHFDVYQNYELQADMRDELKAFLAEKGVGSIIQWAGTPVHQFKSLGFDGVELPYTDAIFKRCLLLPMHTALSNDDVDFVCTNIKVFYSK